MIEITINKADAVASQLETLVCGMVNVVQIHFTLSEHWEGLHKTAVFTNGQTTIDVLESEWLTADTCVLPPEMLTVAGKKVSVGLRGQATGENGVDILPSTLCSLGTVKPGPATHADTSTQESLPVWGQLQEQVADLRNAARACYTTLEKPKAGEDANSSTICIKLHGTGRLRGNLELHVYVCMRRRNKSYYWRHPSNWDLELDEGVVKMGYGDLAGMKYANSTADNAEIYPPVPDWMPNEGYLETVIPITTMARRRGYVLLNISDWLLPLLKPAEEDDFFWSRCGLMGVQGDGTIAPLLFQFRLVLDGVQVGSAENTLAVGIRREIDDKVKFLTVDNTLNGSVLYLSIR